MNRNIVKLFSFIIAVTTLATVFTGCGGEKTGNSANSSQVTSSQSADSSTGSGSASVYPLKTNVTLKYWVQLNANVSPNFKNLGDTPYAKELMKETGINIDFIHPAQGQEVTAFNLMLASGDLPDIIEWDFNTLNGGPEYAISQGYILKLNDIIGKYCPNLQNTIKLNPIYDKYMKTDNGTYYSFPMLKDPDNSSALLATMGPMVRKDWLDELGLEVPTTIGEWETMLKAFKDKKGAIAPLTLSGANTGLKSYIMQTGYFISDYVVTADFYHDGDTVKWGILDPKYKDAIQLLNKWYAEGLLDKNLFSTDDKIREANMLNGKSGATIAWNGANLGNWLNVMKEKDPKFNLAGAPNPTINKGDTPKFGKTSPLLEARKGAITTNCKHVEEAARLLDYGYSKEGDLLMNYGIEGESYNIVDGTAKFTDIVMKNPNKLPIGQAMAMYIRANYDGPLIQRVNVFNQFYAFQQQKDALAGWSKTDAQKYVLYGLTATPEESSEMAKLQSDIDTYHDEMITKFIMGIEPMSNFEKFQKQLVQLGANRMLELKQAQYDRFKGR